MVSQYAWRTAATLPMAYSGIKFFFVMGSHPKQGPAGQAIFYYIMRFYRFITLFGQGVKGLRDLRKAQNNTEA